MPFVDVFLSVFFLVIFVHFEIAQKIESQKRLENYKQVKSSKNDQNHHQSNGQVLLIRHQRDQNTYLNKQ